MTEKEWSEFWKLMDTTFHYRKVAPEERPTYQAALANATFSQLKAAVIEAAKQSRLLPDIADLAKYLPKREQGAPARDIVQPDVALKLWYEEHVKACHEKSVPTAVECKKRGIPVGEYMDRAERAGV